MQREHVQHVAVGTKFGEVVGHDLEIGEVVGGSGHRDHAARPCMHAGPLGCGQALTLLHF